MQPRFDKRMRVSIDEAENWLELVNGTSQIDRIDRQIRQTQTGSEGELERCKRA